MDNPLVQIDPGLFIWTIITFLILLFALKKFAWKPLIDALERRETRIRQSLEDAEKAKEELEQVQSKTEEILARARAESQAILVEGKKMGEKVKDEILKTAKEKANAIVISAETEIEIKKEKAIAEIKAGVVDISLKIAEKLLRRNLTKEDNIALIDESLKRMETRYEA